jgi:two-component system nitrate/nitrite response regulator NarL
MIGASILIVDDQQLFADVIASALAHLGARIVGPVGTAADAIAAAALERPDLVLLDIGLPDLNGIDAARAILAVEPDVPIVALTASTDPRASAEAVKAGLRGYVPKEAPLSTVVEAIDSALGGESVVVPPRRTVSRSNTSPAELLTSALTDREREVLALIISGAASGTIAERLGISTNTVRTHVQSILTKLQVHSRLEAAAFAVKHGLVEIGREGGVERQGSAGAR